MAVTAVRDHYLESFESFLAGRAGADPAWLTTVRRMAADRFAAVGIPTTRDEEWRFTNVAPVAEARFERVAGAVPAVDRAAIAPFIIPRLAHTQLVFVNGRFAPALSTTSSTGKQALIGSLAAALVSDPGLVDPYFSRCAKVHEQALVALNTAFVEDGAFVDVPAGTAVQETVHLLYYTTGDRPIVTYPRTLIVVGDGSRLKVVESYAGAPGARYFTNAVTEIVGGERSHVEHVRVQRESAAAYHTSATAIYLERQAVFSQQNVALGGAIVRNDVSAMLDAEHISCTLNGLYLGNGGRLVDNHTAIDHAKPNCESHEIYKGMLGDTARGVFNGKIFVRQDAQKTDAKQTNKVLLLSEDATINTKPQLEIFADDVKCTHGATVGQLDEESLFYLQARGIGRQQARAMLVHAFASDIVDRISIEPLRESLEAALTAQLPREEA